MLPPSDPPRIEIDAGTAKQLLDMDVNARQLRRFGITMERRPVRMSLWVWTMEEAYHYLGMRLCYR